MLRRDMQIPSDYLQGFLEICRKHSLTAAAKHLGLTQAALTLRLKNLENLLEETLLIRGRAGVVLTEAGTRLLAHAEMLENLEKECLADLHHKGELSGTLRVGCFSTIGRSLVLPALQPLLSKYPKVGLHFAVRELRELPALLTSGEMDIIFLDQELVREGIQNELLGLEEYVLIRSKESDTVPELYLNHDEDDLMSFRYWEKLGTPRPKIKRRYLDEIYSVIDGVASGIGLSVLPRHLIKNDARIKIINPSKCLSSPVYMVTKKRTWQPRHLELAIHRLSESLKKKLANSP